MNMPIGSSAGAMARTVRHAGGKALRMASVSVQRGMDRPTTRFVHEVGQLRRAGVIDAAEATRQLSARGIAPGSVRHAAAMSDVARGHVLLTYGGRSNYLPLPHLRAELRARGAHVDIVRNDALALGDDGILRANGAPIAMPDAIVARGVKDRYLPMFEELRQRGVHMVNAPGSIEVGRSKAAMASVFAEHGIPAPRTIEVRTAADLDRAVDQLGFPLIVKTSRGSGGHGVFKVDAPSGVDELRTRFLDVKRPRLLVAQEFIEGSAGVDHRAFVVRRPDGGHELVAVVRRQGGGGDFRANGPAGSTVTRIDPSGADPRFAQRDVDTALRAARAFDLDVAGVDVGTTGHVWEINTTPGIPELDAFVPRTDHTLPRVADYAVYGAPR
jgi:gamma-F420-2:alpha-L-glutamate ligase